MFVETIAPNYWSGISEDMRTVLKVMQEEMPAPQFSTKKTPLEAFRNRGKKPVPRCPALWQELQDEYINLATYHFGSPDIRAAADGLSTEMLTPGLQEALSRRSHANTVVVKQVDTLPETAFTRALRQQLKPKQKEEVQIIPGNFLRCLPNWRTNEDEMIIYDTIIEHIFSDSFELPEDLVERQAVVVRHLKNCGYLVKRHKVAAMVQNLKEWTSFTLLPYAEQKQLAKKSGPLKRLFEAGVTSPRALKELCDTANAQQTIDDSPPVLEQGDIPWGALFKSLNDEIEELQKIKLHLEKKNAQFQQKLQYVQSQEATVRTQLKQAKDHAQEQTEISELQAQEEQRLQEKLDQLEKTHAEEKAGMARKIKALEEDLEAANELMDELSEQKNFSVPEVTGAMKFFEVNTPILMSILND